MPERAGRSGWGGPARSAYPRDVLLSDKDIRAEIDAGRVRIDPFDPSMVQPSSIDVRLDRYFRVFENHRYPHIDPAVEQADLTRTVEPDGDEAFILHPGEFVLASTYEVISLPDDLASRLEGKSSLGQARAGDAFDGRVHRPRVLRARDPGAVESRDAADQAVAGNEDRPAVHVPAEFSVGVPVRLGAVRVALPGAAWADGLAFVHELPSDSGVMPDHE